MDVYETLGINPEEIPSDSDFRRKLASDISEAKRKGDVETEVLLRCFCPNQWDTLFRILRKNPGIQIPMGLLDIHYPIRDFRISDKSQLRLGNILHYFKYLNSYAGFGESTKWEDILKLENLKYISIVSAGIESIQGISKFKNLEVLELGSNNISDISEVLSMQSLKRLDLQENNIKGVVDLASLPNLKEVDLSHNLLNEIVLKANHKIDYLDLSYNNFTSFPDINGRVKELKINNNKLGNCMLNFNVFDLLDLSENHPDGFKNGVSEGVTINLLRIFPGGNPPAYYNYHN